MINQLTNTILLKYGFFKSEIIVKVSIFISFFSFRKEYL